MRIPAGILIPVYTGMIISGLLDADALDARTQEKRYEEAVKVDGMLFVYVRSVCKQH